MTPDSLNFGREPTGHAIKKGRPTGVDRPKENAMLNVIDRVTGSNAQQLSDAALRTEIAEAMAWTDERIRRAKNGIVAEVVTLTPALAAVLLERNKDNRNILPTTVKRLVTDILADAWMLNGESIIVASNGQLNDGQHRCKAVLEAGKAIDTMVVFGPKRETRFTTDTGGVRSVGNFLAMNGHSDVNALAALVNHVWQYRKFGFLAASGDKRPTKSESLRTVEHYRDLPDSLSFVSVKSARALCSTSMLAFCHWAIRHYGNADAADAFVRRLIDGANLHRGDAALYCRNRLIEMRGNIRSPNDRAELIFRAYNYERRGEKCNRITIAGGKLPDLEG